MRSGRLRFSSTLTEKTKHGGFELNKCYVRVFYLLKPLILYHINVTCNTFLNTFHFSSPFHLPWHIHVSTHWKRFNILWVLAFHVRRYRNSNKLKPKTMEHCIGSIGAIPERGYEYANLYFPVYEVNMSWGMSYFSIILRRRAAPRIPK